MEQQLSLNRQLTELERESWKMDSEKSQAYFHYARLKGSDTWRFQCNSGLEIRPYPNPFSYGGYWCSGGARDEAELQKQIDDFSEEVNRWKKHGLVKVEIKEEPEIDRKAQLRRAEEYIAKTDPRRYREQSHLKLL